MLGLTLTWIVEYLRSYSLLTVVMMVVIQVVMPMVVMTVIERSEWLIDHYKQQNHSRVTTKAKDPHPMNTHTRTLTRPPSSTPPTPPPEPP